MIRLRRHLTVPAPLAGSGANRTQLNNERKTRGEPTVAIDSSVYGHAEVKESLRESQHAQHGLTEEDGEKVYLRCKCAWCESYVERVTSFDEVDHYRPKAHYYWLGYAWENLLISCKPCNTAKGDQFPLEVEAARAADHNASLAAEAPLLLNPYDDEPDEHLEWQQHMLKGRTPRGEETIKALKLNERPELPAARFELLRELRRIRKQLEFLKNDACWSVAADEMDKKLKRSTELQAPYSAMMRAESKAQGKSKSPGKRR